MEQFNGAPYLRVLTIVTTNGTTPKINNGEVQYKESFLPVSAKKQMEKKAARLKKTGFEHLIPIIEYVEGERPEKQRGPRPRKDSPKPKTD